MLHSGACGLLVDQGCKLVFVLMHRCTHHKTQGLHVQSPGIDDADEVGFVLLYAQGCVRAACMWSESSDSLLPKGHAGARLSCKLVLSCMQ